MLQGGATRAEAVFAGCHAGLKARSSTDCSKRIDEMASKNVTTSEGINTYIKSGRSLPPGFGARRTSARWREIESGGERQNVDS
ncbi:MAG: hypothetical protein DMG65_16860 [Candidatus Angelobacter sp. Gp1-AA117]|nr:MAG: hypothetical protein DMG65_16860 [Candidatus Angelobacter sp. Gp1-AA117]